MEHVNDVSSMTLGAQVERYASGRMEPQEEQEFEITMLERPELAAQVEAAQKMRMGLRRLQASGELERLIHRRPASRRHYALAAGIVLLCVGGAVLTLWTPRHPSLSGALALSLTELSPRGGNSTPSGDAFILAHTRSGGAAPFSVGVGQRPVALRILPEAPSDSGSYRITLVSVSDSAADRRMSGITVRSDADGSVRVFLDPRRLTPGDYQISVTGSGHEEHFDLHAAAEVTQ